MEYEMRLCATSLLKSTAPTDGMYLKGKTRCDVARADEDDGAADSRAREVSAAYSALVRAKIFQEQTHTSEAGRRTTEGGRRERGREEGFGIIGISSTAAFLAIPLQPYISSQSICPAYRRLGAVAAAFKLKHIFANGRLHSKLASPLAPWPRRSRAEQARKHRSRRLKRFAVPLPVHLDSRRLSGGNIRISLEWTVMLLGLLIIQQSRRQAPLHEPNPKLPTYGNDSAINGTEANGKQIIMSPRLPMASEVAL